MLLTNRIFNNWLNADQQPVFENVLNWVLTASEPDQAYVRDITYIWIQESCLYLAVIQSPAGGLEHGITDDRPSGQKCTTYNPMVMTINSRLDCCVLRLGVATYRYLLKAPGIIGSISRKGNCWNSQPIILINIILACPLLELT